MQHKTQLAATVVTIRAVWSQSLCLLRLPRSSHRLNVAVAARRWQPQPSTLRAEWREEKLKFLLHQKTKTVQKTTRGSASLCTLKSALDEFRAWTLHYSQHAEVQEELGCAEVRIFINTSLQTQQMDASYDNAFMQQLRHTTCDGGLAVFP